MVKIAVSSAAFFIDVAQKKLLYNIQLKYLSLVYSSLPMRLYWVILPDLPDLLFQSGTWGHHPGHAVLLDNQHDRTIILARHEGARKEVVPGTQGAQHKEKAAWLDGRLWENFITKPQWTSKRELRAFLLSSWERLLWEEREASIPGHRIWVKNGSGGATRRQPSNTSPSKHSEQETSSCSKDSFLFRLRHPFFSCIASFQDFSVRIIYLSLVRSLRQSKTATLLSTWPWSGSFHFGHMT